MRLVLLGNPALERSWKNDVAYAARELGWATTVLQDHAVSVDDVVGACRSADLLIWCRTNGRAPVGELNRMWKAVEAHGCATASVHLDLYWGIPRRACGIGQHPWWWAQHVFTADGGPNDWASRNVTHHWLPPPAPDRYVGRGLARPEYRCDVVFVGSCSSVHAGRRRLLDWAAHRYERGFRWLRGVWGRRLADVYASARVVLGDSAPAPMYWSDRVSATLGRGGVLVHPDVEGLRECYGDAVGYWPRGDLDALGDLIDSLLADDGRRLNARIAGVEMVRAGHMWRHRLPEIARTCGVS